MAFNFLGTINSLEDFQEFEEFVRVEADRIGNRIDHLLKEKGRYYELMDKFKKADLGLRKDYAGSDIPDANWIRSPRSSLSSRPYSEDALNLVDVDELKTSFLDTIKAKRERNEFKIKKIRDLIEQISNEINLLETEKTRYEETLNKISYRFDDPEYSELQKIAPIDSADLEGIKATRKGAGRVLEEGELTYLVLSINANQGTITFDTTAPAVPMGSKIILSGGKNDGEKTIAGYANASGTRTVKVIEPLVTESPSKTKVTIKKV